MAEAWETYLADREQASLDELLTLLRIPSVSTTPKHRADVTRAGKWVANRLRRAGVPEVEVRTTPGHPVVLGRWHVGDERPTVLIYGHYDVQPPEPLDLWESPPFAPAIRDGRVYARGATDMKGNLLATIHAVEALAEAAGAPPVNVTFVLEGEEEIGSPHLPAVVAAEREGLRCDVVLSADGMMLGPETPSLTVSHKGLAACQIDLRTAASDLHSGLHGAAVPNATQAIARLVASLHEPDGRVAVAGFYDRVRPPTPAERAEIAAIPFAEEEYRRGLDVTALWGEPGWSVPERLGARPTIDVNGIWGGFTGEGVKTVTPCEAHAKLTCRLVPDQEPGEILDLIERHVVTHCPPGATTTVRRWPGSARPHALRRDHPALQRAKAVIRDLYGKEPQIVRSGGTVPIVEVFQRELGVDTVSLGWGMFEGGAHAPNEWFRVADLALAGRAYAALLSALAE